MNQPIVAMAAVAAGMVAIFVALWVRDAMRSKAEATDTERLDVENDPDLHEPGPQ